MYARANKMNAERLEKQIELLVLSWLLNYYKKVK